MLIISYHRIVSTVTNNWLTISNHFIDFSHLMLVFDHTFLCNNTTHLSIWALYIRFCLKISLSIKSWWNTCFFSFVLSVSYSCIFVKFNEYIFMLSFRVDFLHEIKSNSLPTGFRKKKHWTDVEWQIYIFKPVNHTSTVKTVESVHHMLNIVYLFRVWDIAV